MSCSKSVGTSPAFERMAQALESMADSLRMLSLETQLVEEPDAAEYPEDEFLTPRGAPDRHHIGTPVVDQDDLPPTLAFESPLSAPHATPHADMPEPEPSLTVPETQDSAPPFAGFPQRAPTHGPPEYAPVYPQMPAAQPPLGPPAQPVVVDAAGRVHVTVPEVPLTAPEAQHVPLAQAQPMFGSDSDVEVVEVNDAPRPAPAERRGQQQVFVRDAAGGIMLGADVNARQDQRERCQGFAVTRGRRCLLLANPGTQFCSTHAARPAAPRRRAPP